MRWVAVAGLCLAVGCGGSTRGTSGVATPDGGSGGAGGVDAARPDGPSADGSATDAPGVDGSSDTPGDAAGDALADRPGDAPADGAGGDAAIDGPRDAATGDGGDGGSVVGPPWTGAAPLLVTSEPAIDFFVAKDENHVAYSTNRIDYTDTSCLGRGGVGALKVATIDPSIVLAPISTYAGFRESFFTDDSKSIVFTDYSTTGSNACANFVYLRSTPSGGGAAATLSPSGTYYYKSIAVSGSTARFLAFSSSASDPGTRYVERVGGPGTSLGNTSTFMQLDPTGTYVYYDGGGQYRIASLSGATKSVLNDGTLGLNENFAWSPDGAHAAYASEVTHAGPITLTLRDTADGGNLRTLSTNCRCLALQFSPDSSMLAYDLAAAGGGVTYVLQPVSGAAPVTLGGLPAPGTTATYDQAAFSSDGRWLDVIEKDGSLWTAPVAPPGPFVRLSTPGATLGTGTIAAAIASSPGSPFIAFAETTSAGTGFVVTTRTGSRVRPRASGINSLAYEQASAARLAVQTTETDGPAIWMYPTDGSGPGTRLSVPYSQYKTTFWWAGPVLVYPTNAHTSTAGSLVDLVAAAEDGSAGVLATDVLWTPKVGRPAATRLFYIRAPVSPATGAGLYMFAPPPGTGGTGGGGASGSGGSAGTSGGSGSSGAAGTSGGSGSSGAAGTSGGSGTAGSGGRGGANGRGGAGGKGGAGGSAGACPASVTFNTYRFTAGLGTTTGVAFGDINHDGLVDAVVTSQAASVIIMLNGVNGLVSKYTYGVQPSPSAVALADVNGDGRLDIIVTAAAGAVQVMVGQGDGTFANFGNYTTPSGPTSVTATDLDGDGDPDFALTCSTGGSLLTFVDEGASYGFFYQHFTYAEDSSSYALAVGDLDGDGMPEIATVSASTKAVTVFGNDGAGHFTGGATYPVGAGPRGLAMGDLDGDGFADLVVANTVDGTISVLRNQRDGTFGVQTTFKAGTSPQSIVVADFNGDGKLDVAAASSGGGGVSVLLGVGDGSFAAASNFPSTYSIQGMAAGDINGDGRPDLLVTNGDTTVTQMIAACGS